MSRLRVDRLTEIARHFTGHADLVVTEVDVLTVRNAGAWGAAGHDGTNYTIRLDSALADNVQMLLLTFAHEIGHIRCGHVPQLERGDIWAVTKNLIAVKVRDAVTPVEERERQATAWGQAHAGRITDYAKEAWSTTFGRAVIDW